MGHLPGSELDKIDLAGEIGNKFAPLMPIVFYNNCLVKNRQTTREIAGGANKAAGNNRKIREQSMSNIKAPEQPLPRKYLQSILFLADRMAEADGNVVARESRMIEELAEAAKMQDFRNDREYLHLSEYKACTMLDIEEAKAAALVVISLVMKADDIKREEELAYFSKIRGMLKCEPIAVPSDLKAHKDLALKYLG